MSAVELETLKEIFHSARELPLDDRGTYLDRACGSDQQLRREVEALLQSHEAANGFITDPPAQLAAEALLRAEDLSDVGKTIGRYQLIERIGSGGMGTVYLARRADQQFEMQVAVKLIKRGMDTESVLRRFAHERQILASLEHANIARLLDGGTTEEGLPYFVMEYIRGERIDRCAEAAAASNFEPPRALPTGLRRRLLRASTSRHSSRPEAVEHPRHGRGRSKAARFRHREDHPA